VEFRILGPLEVAGEAGEVRLASGKQKALLALLLLHADRVVPTTRLVDGLYGAEVPESAQKMVQIFVSKLRKHLPTGLLRTRAPGYLIDLSGHSLDLRRFAELAESGRAALAEGRAADAAELLASALGLWRGPALAEFAEPFAQPESARLAEQQLACLEDRIEADLALGRHAALVGELEGLVGRHPHRERLREQLMLALYRSGRHAEGLESYQTFRRLLDDFGIEPSQRLRDLERRILRQDPELDPPVPGAPHRFREPPRKGRTETWGSRPGRLLVGRDGEIERLRRLLDAVLAGRRRVVLVSGRPGIGKTTLVRAFVDDAEAADALLVGRGQCLQQYGQGEAYMPVLEAIGRLCRGDDGDRLVPLLAERAPTWLSQLPGLVQSLGVDTGSLEVGATRERMLRELVEAVEAIAETRPLALLLEDLHWSDPSTIDVVAALARREDPAPLFVLATYRPQDARATSHPIWATAQELEHRGFASELRLHALTPRAVADYLDLRFPESEFPPDLAELLHERTDGNPLFLEKVVDAWLESGSIEVMDGVFTLKGTTAELSADVPATVRQLIEHQLHELDSSDQELVEAASVAGVESVAAAVAAACGRADEDAEMRLTELARQGHFVEVLGEAAWPDGTVSTRLRFVHDLYAEVAYAQLPSGRRARLHRSIAARLESAFGESAGEIAGELANHLLRGREPDRAISYFKAAADHALVRGGHREAIDHLTTALDALGQLPGTRERAERELALRISLGNALSAGRGYAAPETRETYARARELCSELGENAPGFLPVLYGLWTGESIAGRHRSARELADAFLQLAHERDEDALVVAHRAIGWSLILNGQHGAARGHLEEVLRRFDPRRHASLVSVYGEHPAVAAEATLSLPLWLLGFPDQASKVSAAAVARARTLNQPLSLAYALFNQALLRQLRREHSAAYEAAESARAVAGEFGIALWEAWASGLSGWATAVGGAVEDGNATIRAALRASRATGAVAFLPHTLAFSAEAEARAGDAETGLQALDEALTLCDRNDERYYEPEIHRLRGELLLALAAPDHAAAEVALERALELARAQAARMLELRTAVSLGRLWRDQGRVAKARELLSPVYAWFTEGFDTLDLREAAELLADLGARRNLRGTR
jgi:DNA-binding SARP family transcriptional activator/predicted ATPase